MVGKNPIISSKQVKLKESRKALNSFQKSKRTYKVLRKKYHPLNMTWEKSLYTDKHIYQGKIKYTKRTTLFSLYLYTKRREINLF